MGKLGVKKRRVLTDELVERDGAFCVWCRRNLVRKPIDFRKDCRDYITIEHLKPISKGGTHDLINLALACYECNSSRGSSLEWTYEPDNVDALDRMYSGLLFDELLAGS